MLLTGASAGVGEELAYHYARLGSHLVLTAHTEAFLQKVRHPISSLMVGWEWVGGGAPASGNPCKDPSFLCDLKQGA